MSTQRPRLQLPLMGGVTVLVCLAALTAILASSRHQTPRSGMAGANPAATRPVRPDLTPPPIPTLPTENLPTVALTPPRGIPTWTPGIDNHSKSMQGWIFRTPPASMRPPKVSERQAIAIANRVGYVPGHAPWVTAKYVLLTREPPQAYLYILQRAHLADKHPDGFVDIPVWIVSYEGVRMPLSGGDVSGTPMPTRSPDRELNVIVSAENGYVLGGYDFR